MSRIHKDRIKEINDKRVQDGDYVLYWMQQSQRPFWNHALEFAIDQANEEKLPLLVIFGLMDDYPEANERHYYFMLEGLKETQKELKKRDIKLAVVKGHPAEVALDYSEKASLLVCDRGYLLHQRKWRKKVADEAPCKTYMVESDVVVPVQKVSDKHEYAARTIRPKLHKYLEDFLEDPGEEKIKKSSLDLSIKNELDLSDTGKLVDSLKLDSDVKPVPQHFKGGPVEAQKRFHDFINNHLDKYDENRNQAQTNDISHMSPYLHFGQVSPAWLVTEVRKADSKDDIESYVEELVVRRELSMNFVYYEKNYDKYSCIPDWAEKTLKEHASDKREHVYSLEELEKYDTHDEYWNAAMKEMVTTGFMHNYMRMYWGKKILEWREDPEDAFDTCLYLNNKYFLDGRDANSFANVAWIFGVHDRAWGEFDIFGKVRVMKASGLKKKFKAEEYIEKVDKLAEKA